MKPEAVAGLRRAGLLIEDAAVELMAAAPVAPSTAQTVVLDSISYIMAALSAIFVDLANTWEDK